ncbi:MAG TPA: sodium:solute symporter family protein [Rectinemataceae bacterium]|nr:sodium:solute symporter family protein [Rectinemataceae bacterium]
MQVFLFAYGAFLLSIAFHSSRRQHSFQDFVLADRNQPRILIIGSMLASTIGGGLTLGTVSKAYAIGFPAFWFVAAGALAHLAQGAFLSEKVRKTEALTLPDLAEKLSSPAVKRLTGVIIVLTWTGIAAGQFLAASKVLSSITGLSHQWAVIAAASFLVIYTIMGGQGSILKTDLFQFGVLAIAVLAACGWLFGTRPLSIAALDLHFFSEKFGLLDLLYYLVVVAGSYLICPMMFGRILSSDTPTSARKASYTSALGMFIFAIVITSIGLWARASGLDFGGVDPLNAMIGSVFPSWLSVLMVFGILAAILSTADTVLLTAAGIFEHDVLGGSSLYRTQAWVGIIAAFATVIALFKTDIVDLLLETYQGYTSGIVPALFIALVVGGKKRVRSGFLFAAIACGYALGFSGNVFAGGVAQKIMAFAGIVASSLIAIAGLKPLRMDAAGKTR